MPRSTPPEKPQHYCCVLAVSPWGPQWEGGIQRFRGHGSWASQERRKVSAVPVAPGVFLRPVNSCLAYLGFSEQCGQCEQQDSWRQEQNMTLTVPIKENDVCSLCSHTFSICFVHLWLSLSTFSVLLQMTSPLPLSCNWFLSVHMKGIGWLFIYFFVCSFIYPDRLPLFLLDFINAFIQDRDISLYSIHI